MKERLKNITNELQLHGETIEKHNEILKQMNASINKYADEIIVMVSSNRVRRARIRKGIAQNLKFFMKDLFSKCDQIRSFLWIWSHLPEKYIMENFFCVVRIKKILLITVFSLLNALGVYIYFLILGWAFIGEGR